MMNEEKLKKEWCVMKQSVIVFGRYEGVEASAVEQLSRTILDWTGDYPVCIPWEEYVKKPESRYFFVGTKASNGYLRQYSQVVLTKPEEYSIHVQNDTVYIEGYDEAGVLYGCVDFYNRYVTEKTVPNEGGGYWHHVFQEDMPDYDLQSAPGVSNRGLWTWGHVIYDYQGYFDHMVRLKMNTVIIWNDFPPLNAEQMVAYAHERNIKVIWGFSWLWDTDCLKAGLDRLMEESDNIVRYYEDNYAGLKGDGIYFQSFTELNQEYIGDVLIADAVTGFVNNTAAKLLAKYPGLELQFGLHAESVREKLAYIARTDPRIRIVWENCGAFPFSYEPARVDGFPETMEFVEKITKLREEERFGVVLKGLVKLDWSAFRHLQGRSVLGSSAPRMQKNRIDRKAELWHFIQAGWLINGDKACEMIRLMQKQTGGDLDITALVEDGMFEKKLCYPVALLGELLWDCDSDYQKIVYRVAARDDVEFC